MKDRFGVTKDGVSAACFGDASMFSFHATKVFHTIEGGGVSTQDDELKAALELERNYGILDEVTVVHPGGNAKMSEFQAAMGLCNLRHAEENLNLRRHAVEMYNQLLSGREDIITPKAQEGVTSNYAYYPVLFTGGPDVREEMCRRLLQEDIFARKYFYPLTSDFACYDGMPGFDSTLTPIARRVASQVVTLPLYPGLADEDIHRICRILTQK